MLHTISPAEIQPFFILLLVSFFDIHAENLTLILFYFHFCFLLNIGLLRSDIVEHAGYYLFKLVQQWHGDFAHLRMSGF